jgi:Mce-associated membrane protein
MDDEQSGRRGRVTGTVLVVLAVVCAAAAVYLGVRVKQQAALADARTAAVEAGTRAAAELSSYDYRDLSASFAAVAADSTDSFAAGYRQISANAGPALRQEHSVAKATVRDVAVESNDAEDAVLLVFVDQSVTNAASAQPQVAHNRMRLTMAEIDGVWKIEAVALV